MQRREFLTGIAALPLALALPASESRAVAGGPLDVFPYELARVLDETSPEDLGRRYRALRPQEDDPDRLRALLGLADSPARSGRRRAAKRSDLRRAARNDYGAGRTVQICGWVLSRTEARQCALLSYRPVPS